MKAANAEGIFKQKGKNSSFICCLDYEQSLFRLVVRFRAAIFFRGFLSNNAWLSKKNLKGYS